MAYDFTYVLADDFGHIERARMVSEDIRDGAVQDYLAFHAGLQTDAAQLMQQAAAITTPAITDEMTQISQRLAAGKMQPGDIAAQLQRIAQLRHDNATLPETAAALLPAVKKLKDVFQIFATAEDVAQKFSASHTGKTVDTKLNLSLTETQLQQAANLAPDLDVALDQLGVQLAAAGAAFALSAQADAAAVFLKTGSGLRSIAPGIAKFRARVLKP